MAFKVIDFGSDPNYAQLVTQENGMTKSFPTLALAEQEKAKCKDGVIVCTGLYGPAIFDEHCMLEFIRHGTSMNKDEAKARFNEYMQHYKQLYEG